MSDRPPMNDRPPRRELPPLNDRPPEPARIIPRDVARDLIRELGELMEAARPLRLPPPTAEAVLMGERPLPAWVLDELFDD